MIKAAIEKIEELVSSSRKTNIIEVKGRTYSANAGALTPVKDPSAQTEVVHTLTGILSFLAIEKPKEAYLHIATGSHVELLSKEYGEFRQRDKFAEAEAYKGGFKFGQWYDLESFIIAVQTQFVQTNTTAEILSLVGNIEDGEVRTMDDDGVTQTVKVQAGVKRKQTDTVPNPVKLQPYRTFQEIEQPESLFVFRMMRGDKDTTPKCALFAADADLWELEAIRLIKAWIIEQKPELEIVG